MRNSKRVVVAGLAFILAVAFSVSASRGQGNRENAQTKRIRIVTVVKRTGIVWFERMEVGIKQFAAQNGVDATMMGAASIQPILTDFTVVKSSQVQRDETHVRWTRIALAAAKQSRRVESAGYETSSTSSR